MVISATITLLFHVLFICVGGVCNFHGSVSPQPKFEMQSSVKLGYSSEFYSAGKVHPHECRSTPKERSLFWESPKLKSVLASSLHMSVSSSLSPPYVNWASPEGCELHLRCSLQSSDFLLFHFEGSSFPCLLATTISFLLS